MKRGVSDAGRDVLRQSLSLVRPLRHGAIVAWHAAHDAAICTAYRNEEDVTLRILANRHCCSIERIVSVLKRCGVKKPGITPAQRAARGENAKKATRAAALKQRLASIARRSRARAQAHAATPDSPVP